jgi:succinate-acetate transporter protein
VSSHRPDTTAIESATRIVLRPIANPLPLGFLALAAGTLLVSGLQLEWLGPEDAQDVGLIALVFAAPLQLLAAMFGFLARDVVAGTAMGVLGGTWLAIGLVTIRGEPGARSPALGLFLLAVAGALLIPAVGAAGAKRVPAAVLGIAAARFLCTGVAQLEGGSTWRNMAGVIGLVLCALGAYAALALLMEDARHGTVLPVGRVARGEDSLADGLTSQLHDLPHEAGVRNQL